MENGILEVEKFSLTTEEVLKQLKVSQSDDFYDIYEEIAEDFIEESCGIAKPKAVYTINTPFTENNGKCVTIDNHIIHSTLLAEKSKNANSGFLFVCTCGVELDEWSKGKTDTMESYVAEVIKFLAVMKMRKKLENFIRNTYFKDCEMTVISPGNSELYPMAEQHTLFEIIGNTKETIGVYLTESYLMLPSKSMSGIFFKA